MIMGVGVGAYEGGVAHFFTHAFFKAQLFLAAGIIIHALANEQDVRRMGGLRKKLPFAFWAMLTGVLSICGIPGFSGFFSKDQVIYGALAARPSVALCGRHPHRRHHRVLHVPPALRHVLRRRIAATSIRPTSVFAIRSSPERRDAANADARVARITRAAWFMIVPVAILIVPTVLLGWLMFGGEHSPWAQVLRRQCSASGTGSSPTISRRLTTSGIVLVLVLAGIRRSRGCATRRDGAQADAVERLRNESVRMPRDPHATRSTSMPRSTCSSCAARSCSARSSAESRSARHRRRGSRSRAISAQLARRRSTRSFQTGLVRAYALILVFGAACFIVYYAIVAGGTALDARRSRRSSSRSIAGPASVRAAARTTGGSRRRSERSLRVQRSSCC